MTTILLFWKHASVPHPRFFKLEREAYIARHQTSIMDMQGTPMGSTNQGVKVFSSVILTPLFSLTPLFQNTSDPERYQNPIKEGAGAVASDSLAAESARSGGGFSSNRNSEPVSTSILIINTRNLQSEPLSERGSSTAWFQSRDSFSYLRKKVLTSDSSSNMSPAPIPRSPIPTHLALRL